MRIRLSRHSRFEPNSTGNAFGIIYSNWSNSPKKHFFLKILL